MYQKNTGVPNVTMKEINKGEHMEPTTSSYLILMKYLGVQTVIAAVATTLGFLILLPKTVSEALVRITFTAISSIIFGPLFVSAVHSKWPSLFTSAIYLASEQGTSLGIFYVSAPLQILAGMPAWWIIGAFIRWFQVRSHKDIGEMWKDVVDALPSRNKHH